MATKAKKFAKKAGKKSAAITMPEGYSVIGRAPNWEHEKHPVISGIRGVEREVIFDKGTKKERAIRTFTLQDETIGAVTVWHSTGLNDLFDSTDDGDDVRIEFRGYGQAKKGQNAPKLFACGVRR